MECQFNSIDTEHSIYITWGKVENSPLSLSTTILLCSRTIVFSIWPLTDTGAIVIGIAVGSVGSAGVAAGNDNGEGT